MIATREMTQVEVEHLGYLQSLTHEELVDAACEGDEMAQIVVTSGASDYATLHAAAAKMHEVMTQTFRVRLKSIPTDANNTYLSSAIRRDMVQMGAKWFDCKIDWDDTLLFEELRIKVEGGRFPNYSFGVDDLTKLGTVRKMIALADYVISNQK